MSRVGALAIVAGCGVLPLRAQAQSSVDLYGLVDAYVGSIKMDGAAARTSTVGSNGMSTSFYGIAGSEDLGGGYRAVFALEGFFRPTLGASGRYTGDAQFARKAEVGVAGSFGQVTVGRNTTPFYIATVGFNPMADSFVFSPIILQTYLGNLKDDTAWNDSISYQSSRLAGFNVNAIYSSAGVPGHTGQGSVGGSVLYTNGGFAAVATGQEDTTASYLGTASKQNAFQFGLRYDLGFVKLFAQAQRTMLYNVVDVDVKTYQLGLSIPIKTSQILMSAARSNGTGAPGMQRKTATLAYDYYLSKRTDAYAAVMFDDVANTGSGTSVGVGIRHRF
jgi:predicted porin